MANGAVVTATGTQNIDALLGGRKWNSLSVTYNFPADISYYPADYGGSFTIFTNPPTFQTATQAVRNTVAWAVQEQFMKVSNLTFTLVAATSAADTSIAGVDIPNFGGFGYSPVTPSGATAATLQRQGDYWYDSPQTVRFSNIVRGDNSWRGVLHEIGHTVGLKHGHETGGVSNTTMSADRDSMEFSLMTYRKYIGADPAGDSFADVEKYGAAQTLMMYDIAALQTMYGANYNTNSGDTTYRWSATTGEMSVDNSGQGAAGANRIFMTLWDGNGIDTFDLSNYTTNLQIDLSPGGWSIFDPAQLSIISVANGIRARGNVFNALLFNGDTRSLIENATGGSGNDSLIGNTVGNVLTGGLGNDILVGSGGLDTAQYSGARSAYTVRAIGMNTTIVGPDGTDTLTGIERLQFSDVVVRTAKYAPVTDFNGDGKNDLLWKNTDGSISVWTMDGATNTTGSNYGPFSGFTVLDNHSDFNGDGKNDLLWTGPNGTISVWTMDGATNTAGQNYGPAPGWSVFDSRSDFNGDGKNDIVWKNTDGSISVWTMDGVTNTAGRNYGPFAGWTLIDSHSDFNGDGKHDLVWTNPNGSISVWTMDGVNNPAGRTYGPFAGWTLFDSHSDFNADGKNDLVWKNTDGSISVWTMDGVNNPAGRNYGPFSGWSLFDSHSDFNGDGKHDLVWTNPNGSVSVWTMDGVNNPAGQTYGPFPGWSLFSSHSDFNGDGKNDLVWTNTDGAVSVWTMDGATNTTGHTYGPFAGWTLFDVRSDFNGDGKNDLLWKNNNGSISVWIMDGATNTAGTTYGPFDGWAPLKISDVLGGQSDFNGDGKSDIAWQNTNGAISLWIMDGALNVAGNNFGPFAGWTPADFVIA